MSTSRAMEYSVAREGHSVYLRVTADPHHGYGRTLEWDVKADLKTIHQLNGAIPGPMYVQPLIQLRDDLDRAIRALAGAFPGTFAA